MAPAFEVKVFSTRAFTISPPPSMSFFADPSITWFNALPKTLKEARSIAEVSLLFLLTSEQATVIDKLHLLVLGKDERIRTVGHNLFPLSKDEPNDASTASHF